MALVCLPFGLSTCLMFSLHATPPEAQRNRHLEAQDTPRVVTVSAVYHACHYSRAAKSPRFSSLVGFCDLVAAGDLGHLVNWDDSFARSGTLWLVLSAADSDLKEKSANRT